MHVIFWCDTDVYTSTKYADEDSSAEGVALYDDNSIYDVSNDDDSVDVQKQSIGVCFFHLLSTFDHLSPLASFSSIILAIFINSGILSKWFG